MSSNPLILGCGSPQLDLLDAVDAETACGLRAAVGVEISVEGAASSPILVAPPASWDRQCDDLVQTHTAHHGGAGLLLAPETWRDSERGIRLLDAWDAAGWTVRPLEPALRREAAARLESGTPRIVAQTGAGWLRIVEPHRCLLVPASAAAARAWSLTPPVLETLARHLDGWPDPDGLATQGSGWPGSSWLGQRVWKTLAARLTRIPNATQVELRGPELLPEGGEAVKALCLHLRLLPEPEMTSWWQRLETPDRLLDAGGMEVTEVRWSEGQTLLLSAREPSSMSSTALGDLQSYLEGGVPSQQGGVSSQQGQGPVHRWRLDEFQAAVTTAAEDTPPDEPLRWWRARTPLVREVVTSLKRNLAVATGTASAQASPTQASPSQASPSQANPSQANQPQPLHPRLPPPPPAARQPLQEADNAPSTASSRGASPKPRTEREPSASFEPPPLDRPADTPPPPFQPLDAFRPDILVLDEAVPPERLRLVVDGVEVGGQLRPLDTGADGGARRYRVLSPVLRHGDVVRLDIEPPLDAALGAPPGPGSQSKPASEERT